MDNNIDEEKSIFNKKEDKNELLIELNNSEKTETNTIQDKIAQFVSKLRTSAINLNESCNLIKNSIEATDTNSTSKFIKRIKKIKAQHQKYLEELTIYKNNQELTAEISEKLQDELKKNYDLINDTDTLLKIAEDSLNNPEKYKDKFKKEINNYPVMINKKEKNKEPQKNETEKKEIKEKEIIKNSQLPTYEPVTVNVDFSPQERKNESEIDIKIDTPAKGNVNINKSLHLNSPQQKINDNDNDNKTQVTYKKSVNHQFGLPMDRNNYQKPTSQKAEKKPKEVSKEVDAYDLMMNKSESNAKKLVEFYIEDIEKD